MSPLTAGNDSAGGSVAAATAAALSTRFGLAGTVLGAVLASVVSMVVTASVTGWLHRAMHLAVDREPTRIRSLVVGVAAGALVAVAFRTGADLLLTDLPDQSVAARMPAEMDLRH